jgi:hypothetical protein
MRAALGEHLRNRQPDTSAATCHKCVFSVQCHNSLPVLFSLGGGTGQAKGQCILRDGRKVILFSQRDGLLRAGRTARNIVSAIKTEDILQ